MTYRALHNNVLVRPIIETKEMTDGGVYIPEIARERNQIGVVVDAGPGKKNKRGVFIPSDIKVGMKVMFGRLSGAETIVDGEKLLLMTDRDIMGEID